jgi:hypothetical protein
MREFQREVGDKFNVHIALDSGDSDDPPLRGWVTTRDGGWRKVMDVHADDFATLIRRMTATWAVSQASERAERIRSMALAIIRIADESGACTEAALRIAGYGADEIAVLGTEAATKANEMAGRGPFSIERGASNAAGRAA